MPADNVWVAALLFIIALVVVNLVMVAVVRGWAKGNKESKGFPQLGHLTKPWEAEDDKLKELHERVEGLKKKE